MRKVIVQLELDPADASIKGVRRKLGLKARQIDASFGVPALRPGGNDYAVRIDADVAEVVRGEQRPAAAPAANDVRVTLIH